MRILENTPRRVRLRTLSHSSWYLVRWFVVLLWLLAAAGIGGVVAAVHYGASPNVLQSVAIAAALFFVMAIEFSLPERVELVADLDEGAVTVTEKPLLTLLGSAGNNSFREPIRFRCGLALFDGIEVSEPRPAASDGPAYWLHARTTDGLRRLVSGIYTSSLSETARSNLETFNTQVRAMRDGRATDVPPSAAIPTGADEPKEHKTSESSEGGTGAASDSSEKPTRPIIES